jgi:hypothetical protein
MAKQPKPPPAGARVSAIKGLAVGPVPRKPGDMLKKPKGAKPR